MIAHWPSRLPGALRSDFGRSFIDTRVAKKAETGPPGYRKRYSLMAMRYQIAIAVTQDQLQVFDNFYINTLNNGSLPFTMDQPELIGAFLLDEDGDPVLDDDDQPILLDIEALFLFGDEPPQTVPHGIGFKINFDLVKMP